MSTVGSPDPVESSPAIVPLPGSIHFEPADLPIHLTSFIGRERELAAITELLGTGRVRLQTLVGPGGVGKSRLALEAARRTAHVFADGATFIPLAPLRDPKLVLPTIARALGVAHTDDPSLADRLTAFLRKKNLLLILDNAEHVLDAAPLISALLGTCPGLTALVTSRAVLHLSGEHVFRVPPLTLPDPAHLASVEELAHSDGVCLFADRATAADADFTLTQDNAPTVVAICQRLDGLPLAIELAAARLSHLSPYALLARLERRLPMLRGGPRDQPIRLQTMRDAISWSHDLLSPKEQVLLRRLSVFAGGFTLEAAEAVIFDEASAGFDVLEIVTSLVDVSLVQHHPGTAAVDLRFSILETVREFALEQLTASGEEAAVRDAHARHFVAFAESADIGLMISEPAHSMWRNRLARERDNLRAAMSWLAEQEQEDSLLRLTGALGHYWFLFSDFQEGLGWYDAALALEHGTRGASRALALRWAGVLAVYQLAFERAKTYLDESLELYARDEDCYGKAMTLVAIGLLSLHQGRYAHALVLHEEALALLRELGDEHPGPPFLTTVCYHNIGAITYGQGDEERAAAAFQEALDRSRSLGQSSLTLLPHIGLANLERDRGSWERALELYQEALNQSWSRGNKRVTAYALAGLGAVAGSQGGLEQAARLFGAAEVLHERIGVPLFPAFRARHECMVETVRVQMDEETFATAWRIGRTLPLEQAVAEAITMTVGARSGGSNGAPHAPGPSELLTRRELEVIRLLVEGRSDREIAEALFISRRTAAGHVANILSKLQLPSRAAAAAFAVRHGIA